MTGSTGRGYGERHNGQAVQPAHACVPFQHSHKKVASHSYHMILPHDYMIGATITENAFTTYILYQSSQTVAQSLFAASTYNIRTLLPYTPHACDHRDVTCKCSIRVEK